MSVRVLHLVERRCKDMPLRPDASTTADAITDLAERIARASPESAEEAMMICRLVQSVDLTPDRGAVQDAIESTLVDGEMSEAQLQTATSAVVGAIRG